jgi:hypothetical protein
MFCNVFFFLVHDNGYCDVQKGSWRAFFMSVLGTAVADDTRECRGDGGNGDGSRRDRLSRLPLGVLALCFAILELKDHARLGRTSCAIHVVSKRPEASPVFICVLLVAEDSERVSDAADTEVKCEDAARLEDTNAVRLERVAPFRTRHLVLSTDSCSTMLLERIVRLPYAANHLRELELCVESMPPRTCGSASLAPLRVLQQLEAFRYNNWMPGKRRGVPLCGASLSALWDLPLLKQLDLQRISLSECAGLPIHLHALSIGLVTDTAPQHWAAWFAHLARMTKLTDLALGGDDDDAYVAESRYDLEAIARASPLLVELRIHGECLPLQKLPPNAFERLHTLACTLATYDVGAHTTFATTSCSLLLSLPVLQTLVMETVYVDHRGRDEDVGTVQLAHVIGVLHGKKLSLRQPPPAVVVVVSSSLTTLYLPSLHDGTLQTVCGTALALRHLTLMSANRVTTFAPLARLESCLVSLTVWSCTRIDERMTARCNRSPSVRLRAWPSFPNLRTLEVHDLREDNLALLIIHYAHVNTTTCRARLFSSPL